MIRVQIKRSRTDGAILSFRVEGHASYADPGEDIVCAAVSAITVGTVNAIEKLTGIIPDSHMKDGFLSAAIDSTPVKREDVQLLLESMIVMLQTIEESYGDYIAVQS